MILNRHRRGKFYPISSAKLDGVQAAILEIHPLLGVVYADTTAVVAVLVAVAEASEYLVAYSLALVA